MTMVFLKVLIFLRWKEFLYSLVKNTNSNDLRNRISCWWSHLIQKTRLDHFKYLCSRHHLNFRLPFPLPVRVGRWKIEFWLQKQKNEIKWTWFVGLFALKQTWFKIEIRCSYFQINSISILFRFWSYLGLRILTTSSWYGSAKSILFKLNFLSDGKIYCNWIDDQW